MKKIGRPPKPPHERLKQRSIRMTEDEWQLVEEAAKTLTASQSDVISKCIGRYLQSFVVFELEARRQALDETIKSLQSKIMR